MAYLNNMTFTQISKGDTFSQWFKCLAIVGYYNHCSKKKILDNVWPNRRDYGTDRGYCSSLFAQMNEQNIINYSPRTKTWRVGIKGQEILNTWEYEYRLALRQMGKTGVHVNFSDRADDVTTRKALDNYKKAITDSTEKYKTNIRIVKPESFKVYDTSPKYPTGIADNILKKVIESKYTNAYEAFMAGYELGKQG